MRIRCPFFVGDEPVSQADALARTLVEAYWDMQIPVSSEDFAEKLGLRVVEVDDADEVRRLTLRSASLDPETKVVRVAAGLPDERRRFALAREVGRFCLKEAEGSRNESALRLLGLDPREDEEENRFAAALLLPAIAVKAMLEVRKVRDPVVLREAFGVTSHVLWCRLKELGYFL